MGTMEVWENRGSSLTKRPESADLSVADLAREIRETVRCAFRRDAIVGVSFLFGFRGAGAAGIVL